MLWVQTSSRATVDGEDLTDAQPTFDNRTNEPIVSFRFNQKGALRFGKLTQENVGRPFAIVLDNKVVSAPVINEPILGGTGQISGRFTTQEANDLAIVLRSGALPAKLTVVEERTVGPSLGSDSIRAGVIATIIGTIGVVVFMLVGYGFFGLIANIGLLAHLAMTVGLLSVLGATLTLPGIAGLLLTLGMAVDSNVLVFERIREEWRKGRTPVSAIDTGFPRSPGDDRRRQYDHDDCRCCALHARLGAGARICRHARYRHRHDGVHGIHVFASHHRLLAVVLSPQSGSALDAGRSSCFREFASFRTTPICRLCSIRVSASCCPGFFASLPFSFFFSTASTMASISRAER